MPRRHVLVIDAGSTLMLGTTMDAVYTRMPFRRGPLDGAMIPIRGTAAGLPEQVMRFVGGSRVVYQLAGGTYCLLRTVATSISCPPCECGGVRVSHDGKTWWCVDGCS